MSDVLKKIKKTLSECMAWRPWPYFASGTEIMITTILLSAAAGLPALAFYLLAAETSADAYARLETIQKDPSFEKRVNEALESGCLFKEAPCVSDSEFRQINGDYEKEVERERRDKSIRLLTSNERRSDESGEKASEE